MKFILILLANCFFILYCILYLTDHPFTRASVGGKIRQVILLLAGLYVIYNVVFIYLLKKQKEESGLLYKIFAYGEKALHATMAFIQPIQKELLISIIIAVALAAIGMLLAGLPGAALLAFLQKVGLLRNVKGDSVWPTAILFSVLWPLSFPIAILVKHYCALRGYHGFTGFGGLIGCSWMLLCIVLTSLFGSTKF